MILSFCITIIVVTILLTSWTIIIRLEIWTGEHIGLQKPNQIEMNLSTETMDFHESIIVGDVHADTLVWRRNLLKNNKRGYFDFPKMDEGGAAIQGFLSVTELPKNTTGDNIGDKSNQLTTLGIVDQWPIKCLRDQKATAIYFANKLKEFCEQSNGKIKLIRSSSDLNILIEKRKKDSSFKGALLGLESSDATNYNLKEINNLFEIGYSTCALCHLTDTKFASSTTGLIKAGLTEQGLEAVKYMNDLGMIIDLAHASINTVTDVLKLSNKTPYISHTGSKVISSDPKCLPDEILQEVVQCGGIVGLCFVGDYINGENEKHVLTAIEHLIHVLGQDGLVLGSGFDSFKTPFAVNQLPLITQHLFNSGYDKETIRKVMGGNIIRYFLNELPLNR